MDKTTTIVIAEDDEGHATLITKNLKRAGLTNDIVHLKDGQETIDFFFKDNSGLKDRDFLLLLDIRMPKVDGVEVLKKIKNDRELKKIPIIIITTTDDPQEVDRCHSLGCNSYIIKSVDYDDFVESIRKLGIFLKDSDI